MALNKTDYGLIYNDDGSLCVTIRKDDVPFPGVTSFAVEEGTTNLIVTPLIDATATNWRKVAVLGNGQANVVSGALFGDYSLEISVPNSIEDGGTDRAIWELGGAVPDDIKEAPQPNTTYTLSAWITDPTKAASIQFQPHDSDGQYHRQCGQLTGRTAIDSQGVTWYEVAVTYTTESDVTDWSWGVRVSSEFANSSGTWRACGFQLEKKPFATSFVDGTRPAPRLKIPFNYKGDWVLSFWFRPDWEWGTVPVASAPEPTYNLASWGSPGKNGWLFRIGYNNPGYINLETYAPTISSLANPTDFGLNNRNWAYFVIVSDISNKLFKVYINGQLAISQSNTDWDMPPDDYVSIGTRRFSSNHGAANGLFSNILIARYDPAIWTDAYIQELYRARKPFAVPPRIPLV